MFDSFRKKISYLKYLPLFLIILSIAISSTVYPPSGYVMTIAFIPIICIIFWTLLIGNNLGVFQLFFIGLFTDLLMGTPLGSYLLLFSLLRFLSLRTKERFKINSFLQNIFAAIPLILVFYILNYLFILIYYSKLVLLEYLVLNIMTTIFLYPAIAVIFFWIYRITSIEKYYVKT